MSCWASSSDRKPAANERLIVGDDDGDHVWPVREVGAQRGTLRLARAGID